MTDEVIIDIIKNNINLIGYGTSSTWLGYTELNSPFDLLKANQLIDLLIQHFNFNNESYIVSSTLKIKDQIISDNKELSIKLEKLESLLIKKQLIEVLEEEEDYEEDFPKYIMNPNFKVIRECSGDYIKTFSLLSFADSSIDGHCFILLPKQSLIIYPHEDVGFGFFNYSASHEISNCFHNFITEIESNESFNSFIRKK